jgi:hypothetical protein
MNRVVLIGNGFDLNLGLKTKYSDFLFDFICREIYNKIHGIENNKLIKVFITNFNENFNSYLDIKKYFIDLNSLLTNGLVYTDAVIPSTKEDKSKIKIYIKSEFLKKIIRDDQWNNIEKAYFDYIIDQYTIYNNSKKNVFSYSTPNLVSIEKVNDDWLIIKNEFINYLNNEISQNLDVKKLERAESIIDRCKINPETGYSGAYFPADIKSDSLKKELKDIVLVNFNYTDILNKITFLDKRFNIYNIHGSLSRPNSIIFGYGDDSHPEYNNLENTGENVFLKNIKSFYYPQNNYYNNLINSLDLEYYDVLVIGHSLGLSDRVLLKTIFNHEKCCAIKLIHRGSEESQFESRIALSRHFTNKELMRKRVVHYNSQDAI